MVSVADLIQDNQICANFFDYNAYIRGDLELGLLENRRGDRLLAIPDTLIAALYDGLIKETGQAARLVLFNCGTWWGKNFYTRFTESLEEYYNTNVAQMDMSTFVQCLKECWRTHGWGTFQFDPQHHAKGFILIKTTNSPYSRRLGQQEKRPSAYLEAGVLTSFFCRLTGRNLLAVQIACESLGSSENIFVIGLEERLKKVSTMVNDGLCSDDIMANLLADSGSH